MVVTHGAAVETLDPILIQALEARLLGTLIQPSDDEYEAARRTHSPGFDRRPALIVRAADAADVIRAVEFGRTHALPVAVRSGGHSIPGHSTVDDGVIVDLSQMNVVSVDPVRRTAWVQPGATTADLVAAAEPHGLALSTGDTSSVGLGGLTLGGGIGWMVRKYGLTIDSLLSAEVVTADGRLIVASEDEHPDLFWAVRGGGGNFGIVTGFEFQLHEVDMILGGALVLPATREVLEGYAAYAPIAPDELTTIAFMMPAPPIPFLPEEAHGKLAFMILACYAGDHEEGQRALAPLRALAEPLGEVIAPMPYSALYQFTAMGAAPHDSTVRSGYMHDLPTEAIEVMFDHVQQRPAALGVVQIRALGGALARVPAGATAFAHRDKTFLVAIIRMGRGEEVDSWVLDLWQRVQPHASGVYVNFLADEGEARVREAYTAETYARLAEIKRRYDPENIFKLNQNIMPAE